MRYYLFVVVFISVIFSSCARIYNSPDAERFAGKHKVIAVLPPNVSLPAKKNISAEALESQRKTESKQLQKDLTMWLVRRKMQGKIKPDVMEVETVNARLQQAGFPDKALSAEELCKALGVDAYLVSDFSLSKPMSEGAAIAVGILFGAWGPTNEARISLSMQDCNAGKLIWNYEHRYSGGVGSSSADLIDGLMRNASRRMPYKQK